MDNNFYQRIENLFKNRQFETIRFEFDLLSEREKKNPYIHNILGIIEADNNNYIDAKNNFYYALELDEYYLPSLINLSKISYVERDFQNIILLLKKYYKKNQQNTQVILSLADLSFSAGFIEDSIYFHKKLIESKNFKSKDLAALIFLLNYSIDYSENEYKKYCELYNQILEKNKIEYNLIINQHDPTKIGFISSDLRNHSVGYFLKDFIQNLKQKNIKPIAFNLFKDNKNDPLVPELKKSFHEWFDVSDLNDKDLSDFIYSKKIYYLIDLAGYSHGNRLQVFKNKPAPVQLSWLGYCNNTNIKEIDFMIADQNVISVVGASNEAQIIKLPKIWNVLSKLNYVKINELPFTNQKKFNFGCFNNFLKISDETIEVWGDILSQFTNSNLILKNSVTADKNFKKYFIKKLNKKIDEDRIMILDYEKNKKDHLEQYLNIDLSLDTFPYNGVTTTFESLWMGVPVITLKGDRFISRCGYSINKNAGLLDFIAINKYDYVHKAISFQDDQEIKKLSDLRKSLRLKVMSSPLFDINDYSNQFIKHLTKS